MIYGYTRVSTKGQARDGNSLEAQEKAFCFLLPVLSFFPYFQLN